MAAELLSHRDDAHPSTLILTLSNPGARNALGPEMYAAAIEALDTASRDDSVRTIVLTGADHFFCAGGNLNRLLGNRARDKQVQRDSIDQLNLWIEALRSCPKPVIAAVEGAAAGAGFSLVLACDFVIAAADAKFVMAYVNVGLTPDGGASWHLARALPRPLASEVVMLGRAIGTERLAQFGLVNQVVKPGDALDAAKRLAEELATRAPNSVARIKSLLAAAPQHTLADHLPLEREHFVDSLHHRDGLEGITAFLEKRKPIYK